MERRIAILGAGVAGLACAHYLARSGERPIVLEPSGALGPLGFRVVPGGSAADGGPAAASLVPGSAVAVDLMRGDLQVSPSASLL